MTISQADALRAIELLIAAHDRMVGLPFPAELEDDVSEFLYDPEGEPRFEERDIDPSPDCRCEECSPGNYTCISED